MSDDEGCFFKFTLLGEGEVGKISICKRYVLNSFEPGCSATVGANSMRKDT